MAAECHPLMTGSKCPFARTLHSINFPLDTHKPLLHDAKSNPRSAADEPKASVYSRPGPRFRHVYPSLPGDAMSPCLLAGPATGYSAMAIVHSSTNSRIFRLVGEECLYGGSRDGSAPRPTPCYTPSSFWASRPVCLRLTVITKILRSTIPYSRGSSQTQAASSFRSGMIPSSVPRRASMPFPVYPFTPARICRTGG